MSLFMRTSRALLVLLLSLPLLTGCWDRLDPENMAFIIAVGVDSGPKNDYIFTFAIAVPKTSGGGQSSNDSQKKIVSVHSEQSSDIATALLASQSFVARRLTLIHSKAFILGEGMARKGVMPVLGEVVRNREFRRTVNVITTRGKAETFIQHIQPTTEKDINLWFELELDPHNVGGIVPMNSRFHDFIMDIENVGTGATTILAAPRPDIKKGTAQLSKENEHSDSKSKQPLVGEQFAGSLRRSGEVPVEFFGSAIYNNGTLAGFLTGEETKILNVLRGEFFGTTWGFRDPSESKLNLSINMRAQKKAQMKVTRKNDKVTVTFSVKMEGDLIGVQTVVDYTKPENTKKLEQSIQNQLHSESIKLLNKTLHQWQVDCFSINNRLKSTFSTLKEWYAFKWKDRMKDIDYNVEISFKMRRHGDQVGPAIEGDKMQ
ncbi:MULTISPECIES: Ger(x)C family spore germination protein [unclassified Paenibacillus]|uniref:Ger(x)C family spore germination protein n=1 Tax=unclassified Paenibacillus TaxID=185978 RepID=UPI00362E0D79